MDTPLCWWGQKKRSSSKYGQTVGNYQIFSERVSNTEKQCRRKLANGSSRSRYEVRNDNFSTNNRDRTFGTCRRSGDILSRTQGTGRGIVSWMVNNNTGETELTRNINSRCCKESDWGSKNVEKMNALLSGVMEWEELGFPRWRQENNLLELVMIEVIGSTRYRRDFQWLLYLIFRRRSISNTGKMMVSHYRFA